MGPLLVSLKVDGPVMWFCVFIAHLFEPIEIKGCRMARRGSIEATNFLLVKEEIQRMRYCAECKEVVNKIQCCLQNGCCS